MRSIGSLRRLLFIVGTVIGLVGALVGTQLATRPAKAQVVAPIDVFVFHCALIPNVPLESSNLGSNKVRDFRPRPAFSSCGEH
jgi:disulfide bond formation protein DsbB